MTTALMGNCGVTFAPCKPADRLLPAAMMETVEDIPREAIQGGLPWDWEDYGGYLDSIERLQPGINLCGLVGHSGLRFYVMGERAVEERASHDGTLAGQRRADLETLCQGRDITALAQVRSSGFVFGLQSAMPMATRAPGWRRLKGQTLAQRLATLADPALFTLRMFNPHMTALAHLIASPNVLPGLGDAGAHVSQVMDAGWASFVLSHWVRDQRLYSLAEGERRLTSAPAAVLGLKDRGVLAPGARADVNVFDADRIGECQSRIVHDFPGGAARFIQHATGYKATQVNGRVNLLDGELTGERAGRVLRHGA